MSWPTKVADRVGRWYWVGDERFPSVTSILSGGVPKPELVDWAASRVATYVVDHLYEVRDLVRSSTNASESLAHIPFRERDAAAALGSQVHRLVEERILTGPLAYVPPEARPYIDSFVRWVSQRNPSFEAAEAVVVNRTIGYAGTLDALALIDGRMTVIDWKTGSVWPDAALQLTAYAHAEQMLLPDGGAVSMPSVEAAMVVALGPDGPREVYVNPGPENWAVFLAAKEVWAWREKQARP